MVMKKAYTSLICHGHSRPVVDVFYSPVTPDGIFLISASKDSAPMLRNGENGDWIGTFEGHKGAVWSCCLDTNALIAATGSADFTARVWDAFTGDEKHRFEHKHIVRACAFSKDSNLLLTGGMEKLLRVYDLNRPDAAPREVDSSPGSIRAVSWLHSDQTLLSTCTNMGGIRLWDVRSGKTFRTLETKSSVTSVEVSQDGRYITTVDGSSVKFWDANHFGLVKSYDMPCVVESASLEPKYGNMFVVGGEDMWLRVFDIHTGQETACNKGHHGPVHCVRFSPGGDCYTSGSEDGTIRIWKTGPLTNDNNTNNRVEDKMERLNIKDVADGKVKVKEEKGATDLENSRGIVRGTKGCSSSTSNFTSLYNILSRGFDFPLVKSLSFLASG